MREFKRFENVSILYADICNFTPLTTTLEPYQLVQTLNDLFGKFDDAAEVRIIETNSSIFFYFVNSQNYFLITSLAFVLNKKHLNY